MTEITFKSSMDVEFVDKMGNDETVARAARISTGKDQLDQGKIEGLIGYLMREGHSSCFEHCTLTVRVHAPVFVMRQIYTHRTLSKNSESGRYKELEPVFYVPSGDRPLVNAGSGAHPNLTSRECEDDEGEFSGDLLYSIRKMSYAHSAAWRAYSDMVRRGIATEVARNVLPVSIYTSAYLTGNLLGWFNFLRLRNGDHGHPQFEIVEIAKKVEAIIAELFPITYNAWKELVQ